MSLLVNLLKALGLSLSTFLLLSAGSAVAWVVGARLAGDDHPVPFRGLEGIIGFHDLLMTCAAVCFSFFIVALVTLYNSPERRSQAAVGALCLITFKSLTMGIIAYSVTRISMEFQTVSHKPLQSPSD
jgi:hypothetical protein